MVGNLTDHKPLTTILGPKSGIPTLAAAHMQRWALILSAYTYQIVYRTSGNNANADAMSRLPVSPATYEEEDIFQTTCLEELPVRACDIKNATKVDPVLAKVVMYTSRGWPQSTKDLSDDLKPFYWKRNELTIEQGCILWGLRVVIPQRFQERLLHETHEEHPGICRMKALARSYLWWPQLDKVIETKVKSCEVCAAVQNSPPATPLYTWKWPSRIWQHLHINFAQKGNNTFLVLIDSHSKWLEVIEMRSTTDM